MAARKDSKVKDDQTKKRKRDIAEEESKAKRARAEKKQAKANKETNGDHAMVERPAETALEGNNALSTAGAGWKVSKPMGGRMLDIDPILSADEQYLILTYNTSIQVYSAVDSLLIRRIPIGPRDGNTSRCAKSATIVSTRLSKQNPHHAWVACSDGQVHRVDWTRNSEVLESFQTGSRTAKAMAIVSWKPKQSSTPGDVERSEDWVMIAESASARRMDVAMYYRKHKAPQRGPETIFTIKRPGDGLQLLEASQDGEYLVGALNDGLLVGAMSSQATEKAGRPRFTFVSFNAPDLVTCLDLRVHQLSKAKRQVAGSANVVDVLVGGARGSIYVYEDAFSQFGSDNSASQKQDLQPRKFHWHRKAVHAAKWSHDGHYIISGGSENVLVLWQLDTSKRDYLPHLSGAVENLVVSHSGSSYLVHLDDNSTMILSTAELQPTAYISGIQSAFAHISTPKDLVVDRAWGVAKQIRRPVPATVRPGEASKLHLCVGNGQQATMSGEFSAPLLQSFDLESFSNISKQALTRTQPTDVNLTNKGIAIDEPLVTHLSFSADGSWLASVDDWSPSAKDLENMNSDARDQFARDRHETYLKFWDARDGTESLALVSRINNPHDSTCPEAVLGVTSDPTTPGFATLGGDGMVRIWRPRLRQHDGIASVDAAGRTAYSWGCTQIIPLGANPGHGAVIEQPEASVTGQPQGGLAFSEDGSTLFAAYGATSVGAVYVVDAKSGEVVKTLEGMWSGSLRSLEVLSSYVVALSDELRVYDIVGDELRYGVEIPRQKGGLDLVQMAVDHTSGRFAVSMPVDDYSSIGIFDPVEPQPALVHVTPHRIISLVSTLDTPGFIVLDDAAQISVISEGSGSSALATAQPLQDINLDGADSTHGDDASSKLAILNGDDEEMQSEDDMDADAEPEDVEMDEGDDDDSHPRVIPQQRLADIFDAAPAFSAPSVEDMFYKVTSLLATKPLSTSQA